MRPIYRATVYEPRSVDESETTVLTPPAGAAHSDDFKVATATGVTGFQPYLEPPRGRRGSIDPLKRTTDTGEIVLRLLDKRTGTSNAARWFTAFVDEKPLMGCKIYVEISTDGGTTWSDYFTGRVRNPSAKSRLWVEISARDMADDLDQDIFVGAPESSITYAAMANIFPVNNCVLDYGNVKAGNWAPGSTSGKTTNAWGNVFTLTLDLSSMDHYANTLLDGWPDMHQTAQTIGASWDPRPEGLVHVFLKRMDTLETGEFRIFLLDWAQMTNNTQWYAKAFTLIELPATDPNYLASPPDGTSVEMYVYVNAKPTKVRPLIIQDVHPVQLWADLLDGKFGRLQDDGTVTWSIARDTAAFNSLISDTSFGTFRMLVYDLEKLNDFVEKTILPAFDLGYYLDASGRVVPIDMRQPTSITGLPELTDADLTSAPPTWEEDGENAITEVDITYYEDIPLDLEDVHKSGTPPSISAIRVSEVDHPLIVLGIGNLGLKYNTYSIDARGCRFSDGETLQDRSRGDYIRDRLQRVAESLRNPFGRGPRYLTLPCRRTSNVLSAAVPGALVKVTASALANPATNERSGTMLGRVVEVTDDGADLRVTLLYLAPSALASAPTLGTVASNTADPYHAIDIPITLNAAGDPAVVRVAAVSTGSSQPADDDPAWSGAQRVTSSKTLTYADLPSNKLLFVEARSEPDSSSPELPSAWVSGSASTSSYTAPSGLSVSSVMDRRAKLSWTPGTTNTDVVTEVFITTGGSPGSWTDSDLVATVRSSSVELWLLGLDGPSAQHTVGLRHRGPHGGTTSITELTFTTGSTSATVQSPKGMRVINDYTY